MGEAKIVEAAVVQAAPPAFDTEATLEKFAVLAKRAADAGAEFVVFPEAFIGGYPKGADFGTRVGMRSEAGRGEFARYFDGAIEVPGPATDRLCEIAGDFEIDIVTGVIERDGGTLYCTALFLGRDGTLRGTHRKLLPTAMERVIWGRGDASTIDPVDMMSGRAGAAICWENYMPALRMHLYRSGVELYCAPTVDDRDQWQQTIRHIAYEGRCFVLSACQYATRGDYPDDYACLQGDDPATVLIAGGSAIVDPFGNYLAGPAHGEETVLTARLDFSRIAQGKFDLDVAGHYDRTDVFDFKVRR